MIDQSEVVDVDTISKLLKWSTRRSDRRGKVCHIGQFEVFPIGYGISRYDANTMPMLCKFMNEYPKLLI